MGKGSLLSFSVISLLISGCEQRQPQNEPESNKKISEIETKLDDVKGQISGLNIRLNAMNTRLFAIERAQNNYSSASFDPTADQAYQRVDTNVGPLLIVLENIEPFADGTRAHLTIGNMASANFAGVKLAITWSPRVPTLPQKDPTPADQEKFNKDLTEWSNATQNKETEIPSQLKPGTWNKLTISLPHISLKDLGSIDISATVKTVSLHTQ